MAENETNGTTEKKSVELVGITLPIFPDYIGARAEKARDFKIGDKVHKFQFFAPIPDTDEKAQGIYNLSLADLIIMGVRQHTYNTDSTLRNTVAEDLKNGMDFSRLEDVDKYVKVVEESLFYTEPERKPGAAAANKKKAAKLDGYQAEAEAAGYDGDVNELIQKLLAKELKKQAKNSK